MESYYPERKPPIVDEVEPVAETKPSKAAASNSKKASPVVEIDKTALLFDEKIKEIFLQRYASRFHLNYYAAFSLDKRIFSIDVNVYELAGVKSNFTTIQFMNNQHKMRYVLLLLTIKYKRERERESDDNEHDGRVNKSIF